VGAPAGLNVADPGIGLLARAVADVPVEGLLLAHCGDLPGVAPGATRLVLDVREHRGSLGHCVPAAAAADPLEHRRFTAAACWPRAHLGLDFSRATLATAAVHLRPGGRLLCAVRKDKGAERLGDGIEALLGTVEIIARDRGYRLLEARRGAKIDEALARSWCERRYLVSDPRLPELVLESVPGVFARRKLDAGTCALLDVLDARPSGAAPRRVIDLGCGIGPLALWAARRGPQARVLAIDAAWLAVEMTAANARRAGLAERIEVRAADGLSGLPAPVAAEWRASADLVLVNPPTHAPADALTALLAPIRSMLAPRGETFVVVNRAGRAAAILRASGLEIDAVERDGYVILRGRAG
jgi:16S rRNA G1207 methylase RsmC